MIAAPALSVLALVSVRQRPPAPAGSTKTDFYDSDYFTLPLRFRCPPTVTAVSLVVPPVPNYGRKKEPEASSSNVVELDAPSLRFFRYHGHQT